MEKSEATAVEEKRSKERKEKRSMFFFMRSILCEVKIKFSNGAILYHADKNPATLIL